MIGFTFIFHCTIIYIYIYCIYSLNCLWQQIKSDIHVKFILIKLYKNCLLWENTATPQIFIPEDRQMDEVWRLRNPWALLHSAAASLAFAFYAFLQRRESKSFHEANSNINRCTNKINIFSHTYTAGMIKWKWDTLLLCDENLFCSTWW